WVRGTSKSAASRQQDLISAPVQSVSSGRIWVSGMPNWLRYILQIRSFSLVVGRSRKKSPSNLSARENSGGSLEMSMQVPMKKTSLVWSDNQVRRVPNNRVETPLS